MNLCVIPARGGSKRIPRKNIKEFCGKPMIAYAIEAAKSSNLFDKIIVSTDDSEIASISKSFGVEVPFKRPDELANDYAGTVEVIAHAIIEYEKSHASPERICCIYPCVPLIQPEDIRNSLKLLESNAHADYVFPVTEFPSAIQRGLKRNDQGLMSSFYPEYEQIRSQDLEPAYYDAGQFYWGWRSSWLENNKVHNSAAGYLIPSWRVVDIDTSDDWKRAELLFNQTIQGFTK
jgi:pseudaminic acid cytidylyltransferase